MAHHPEKFLDGRMLWRGRIYSPLPFVRSLWGERINAGVWGTAAFPSVYRTDVHPFAFLPHSISWQVLSFVLTLGGVVVAATGEHDWAAALLLGDGRRRHRRRPLRRTSPTRMRSEVDLAAGQPALVPRDGRVPALPPAVRAAGRADPRRPLAARSRAAARRGADEPRAAAVAARSLARAAAHLGQRHRGSVLERDLDVGRPRAVATHRLAAAVARRPHASKSTKAGPTIATSAFRRPLGVARRPRARRGARRRQESLLRVSTHLRPTSFGIVSALGLATRAARRRRVRRWRCVAAGRRDRRGGRDDPRDRRGSCGARRRRRRSSSAASERSPSAQGMIAMKPRAGAAAAHLAVAAPHLRPAQRDDLRR